MPETTVLMSVRNDERHVGRAAASILEQGYRDFEFLIVDDASTDGTGRILAGLADPRVRVVTHKEALGLTRSLNEGLGLAQGRYVARMDGDDVSLPTRLEKQVAYLRAHPQCGLLGTGYRTIDGRGRPLNEGRAFAAGLDLGEALKSGNQFAHASVMFPREAVAAVGAYREFFTFAQDYDLFLRLAEKYSVAMLPEVLLERRLRLDSVSIRHRVLQDRFADLARECARQRRESGRDPVAGARRDGAPAGTGGLFPSSRERRALEAEGCFSGALFFKNHWNGHAYRIGYALRLLLLSLRSSPPVFFRLARRHAGRFAARLLFPGRAGRG